MNNEEKAYLIALKSNLLEDYNYSSYSVKYGALEMAKWKDKEFLKFLKKNHLADLIIKFEELKNGTHKNKRQQKNIKEIISDDYALAPLYEWDKYGAISYGGYKTIKEAEKAAKKILREHEHITGIKITHTITTVEKIIEKSQDK